MSEIDIAFNQRCDDYLNSIKNNNICSLIIHAAFSVILLVLKYCDDDRENWQW